MTIPRILAIRDVRLIASPTVSTEVESFYTQRLRLERVRPPEPDLFMFRGYPASGPRLLIRLTDDPPRGETRRVATLQVGSLKDVVEQLTEVGWDFEFTHGLSFFDRRVSMLDPAGNRLNLVTSHTF